MIWFLVSKYLELVHELLTEIEFANSFFHDRRKSVYHLYNPVFKKLRYN